MTLKLVLSYIIVCYMKEKEVLMSMLRAFGSVHQSKSNVPLKEGFKTRIANSNRLTKHLQY